MGSARGALIQSAIDADVAMRCGLQVTLGDITYLDFLMLRALVDERAKYEKELMDKERQKIQQRGHYGR